MKRRICTLVAMCAITAQLVNAQSVRWIDMAGEQPTPKQYHPFYATVVLDEQSGGTTSSVVSVHNLTGVPYIPLRLSGFLVFGVPSGSYSIPYQWLPDWREGLLTETPGYVGLNRETLVFDGAQDPYTRKYILVGSANLLPAYYESDFTNAHIYPVATTINRPSGYEYGRALGISADSRYIVGFLSDRNRSTVIPFYCLRTARYANTLTLPSGYTRGIAVDVSDNGMIVGEVYTNANLNGTPVKWFNPNSYQILQLPQGYTSARVLRISRDGQRTLGIAQSSSGAAVVVWYYASPAVIYTTTNQAVEADMDPNGDVYILDNRKIFYNNGSLYLYLDLSSIYDGVYGLRLSSTTGATISLVTRSGSVLAVMFVGGFNTSNIRTFFYSYPTAVSSDGKFMLVEQRFNLDRWSPSRSYVVDTNYDDSNTGRGIELHPQGGYAWDISDGGRYNHRIASGAYNYPDGYKPIVYEVTSPPLQLTRIPTDASPERMTAPLSITADGTAFITRTDGYNSYLWTFDDSVNGYRVSSPFTNILFHRISGNGRYVVGIDHNYNDRMTIYDRQSNSFSIYSISSNNFYITDNRKVVYNANNGVIVWNNPSSSTTFTGCYAIGVSMDGRWIVGWRPQSEGVLIDVQNNTVHSINNYFSSTLCNQCSLDVPRAISKNGRYIVGVGIKDGEPTFYLLELCQAHNGDVDQNRCVDDADLLQILFSFGSSGSSLGRVDVNCDGVVDDADLLIVLFNFGSGC